MIQDYICLTKILFMDKDKLRLALPQKDNGGQANAQVFYSQDAQV